MRLQDELTQYVRTVLAEQWTIRDGRKVPEPDDITLGNEGVQLDAAVIYADLAESTNLVRYFTPTFAAEVYKSYLYCAAKVIRNRGGVITAYDGDRVMGVFIGDSKNNQAARCGLEINWAVHEILRPALKRQYTSTGFELRQRVGVDTSKLLVAQTGIRGSNDLVWVGNAANNAAKMAALPMRYSTYISAETYNCLNDESKYANNGRDNMWVDLGSHQLGHRIYGSTYWWSL